jgi:hypothetical protein
MPIYTFYNKKTQETWEELMTISEMESTLEENQDWDVIPGAPLIASVERVGQKKPSEGFRDVLRHIKRKFRTKSGATDGIETF